MCTIKTLTFAVFFVSLITANAFENEVDCKGTVPNQKKIDQVIKNLKDDHFFALANNRSSYKNCQVSEDEISFLFSNKDKLVLSLSDVAPGEQLFFAISPPTEKEATNLALSTLPKLNNSACKVDLNKPDENIDPKTQEKTKIYWCEEIAAVSVTLSKLNKVLKIRSWMVN